MSAIAAINPSAAVEVIWRPIPDSSQELAIDSRCNHTLYEGARGPGKTITQLMRFRSRVGIGYGEYWKGVIFDREFDDLKGLVAESKKWFYKFDDGAKFMESASAYKWVWPTGEELLFRHVKKIEDYDGFHGQEFPFIGWNELTKQPTGELYNKFMSVNRSSFTPWRDTPHDRVSAHTLNAYECPDGNWRIYQTRDGKPLPKIPLEVFSTTNPNGPGHNWVKRRFIDAAPRGTVVRTKVEIFNPQTQENDVVTKTQVAIFGSYRENIYLDPGYIAELESISDPNLRRAWLLGDWDVVTGGAFDDVWDRRVHVIPRFVPPKSWHIDRSFDWGSTHPFSVGWWAEANGEEATLPNGQKFCPPKGTLIRLYEWYGTKEIGSNEGLKLSATAIAEGIRDIEIALMYHGYILTQPTGGPADNQISQVTQVDVETIEKKMRDIGISWTKSDKSQGSRVNGLELVRERLEASKKREGPGLYFMDCCKAAIGTVPTLPRDPKKPNDVDTDAEDHVYDEIRYRVLAGNNRAAKNIKFTFNSGG